MDERVRFVGDALVGDLPFARLCALYGISRQTGYKWMRRYREAGPEGLLDRSRRPRGHSKAVAPELVERIVAERQRHPTWGPRKLRVKLSEREPQVAWPAASTIGEVLKREGLVEPRRRRRHRGLDKAPPRAPMDCCNQTWATDFKGHFLLGNGQRIYPLTITDTRSRFILGIEGLAGESMEESRVVFLRVFEKYGLPEYMLSDGGRPFASHSLGGLTRLSAWLVCLGITPVQIQPGKPQQNGRHERMHRTLKRETARPPAKTRRAQQRRFDAFRSEFNQERPHEALGQIPPGRLYTPSARPMPATTPELMYPGHFEVRRVRTSGEVKWQNGTIYASQALIGLHIAFEEIGDDVWLVQLGHIQIGLLRQGATSIRPLPPLPRNQVEVSTMFPV